jgi:hypothetical protein
MLVHSCRPTRVAGASSRRCDRRYANLLSASEPEFPLDWATEPSAGTLTRAIYVAAREPLDNPLLSPTIPQQQQRST